MLYLTDCFTKLKNSLVRNDKVRKKINNTLSVLIIGFILSCSNSSEEIDKIAKVYVDISVIEDYYDDQDSIKIKTEEVFSKYNISEEKYKLTFEKFGTDKETWDEFYKLANTYLDTLKAQQKRVTSN